ncbi:MAG: LuxR family transcriptional regulator [Pseudomonadota bacterium]
MIDATRFAWLYSPVRALLQDIDASPSTEALWALMRGYFHSQGFDKISYHHIGGGDAPSGAVTVAADGFDQRWVCEYIREKLFLVDPITDLAMRETRPFLWSEIPQLVTLSAEQNVYLARMEAARLGNGLAFQVFGPGFRNGYVGLGFAPEAAPPGAADILEYQFAAQAAHIRYCALTSKAADAPALSPRERDVLQWIARGKSNSVIADILGLSPHTVDTLMRRVYDKLGTRDRTTAAIEGLGAGLILP